MAIGSLTETVTVEAIRGDTVNRTSGEVSRVVDGATIRSLALSGRNYLELASLVPGAVMLDDDQMAVMTGLGTGGTVINGNRGNSNSLTRPTGRSRLRALRARHSSWCGSVLAAVFVRYGVLRGAVLLGAPALSLLLPMRTVAVPSLDGPRVSAFDICH